MAVPNVEYIKIGQQLAARPAEEQIVITGIAARLPESNNVEEFGKNLEKKMYMITNDDRRWKRSYEDTPYSMGKINFLEKFDAGFFGVGDQQTNFMDPQCRQLLERAVEAIIDSGYNPSELQQTKTGVFVGSSLSDSEKPLLFDNSTSPHFGIEGCNHSMLAHQISYHLRLNGPSTNLESACSSSLYCFEQAYRAIKCGAYDNAIVAASHINVNPVFNQFFYKLGIVSLEDDTMIFNGKGYVRSEAVVVLFLQRAKDARRVYAEVLHTKTNVDGFKEEGITFPSQPMISQLISETLLESGTDPNSLFIIEPHATGTRTGDPEELNAIYEAVCKHREAPILVGSVKSSIGHTEPVSGIASMVKVMVGMNKGLIYSNCNFHKQTFLQEEMSKIKMRVIDRTMEWPKSTSGIVGFSSYGIGGANGFSLLKRWSTEKIDSGIPTDELPRLVCFSARNERCLQPIFKDLSSRSLDAEYVRLWHAIYRHEIYNHTARGFVILSKNGERMRSAKSYDRIPLCLVFDKVDRCSDIIQQLSQISLFRKNVERLSKNLTNLSDDSITANVVLHCALIDTLREIGVEYQYVIGTSFGLLSAAYADDVLSVGQLLLSAQSVDLHMASVNGNKALDETSRLELLADLRKITPDPKKPKKWILQTTEDDCISTECIINSLFDKSSSERMSTTGFVTIGKIQMPDSISINLLSAVNGYNLMDSFLMGLGRMYQMGQNLSLEKLYPNVPWPVNNKTPMISPLIEWVHDEDWFVYRQCVTSSNSVQTFDFSLKGQDSEWAFLTGHVLDGRCITPISAFIYMVWDTFSRMTLIMKTKMRVKFEEVKMHKTVNILDQSQKKYVVRILKQSGKFEVEEMGKTIVTGKIRFGGPCLKTHFQRCSRNTTMSQEDIYKKLLLRGYNYSGSFQGLRLYDWYGRSAEVAWNNNWITFIDSMIQLSLLSDNKATLELPVGIDGLVIDTTTFSNTDTVKTVIFCDNFLRSQGIELYNVRCNSLNRQKDVLKTFTASGHFIPYHTQLFLHQALFVSLQVIFENVPSAKLKIVEVVETKDHTLSWMVQELVENLPCAQAECSIFANAPLETNGVPIFYKQLPRSNQCDLVIATKVLEKKNLDTLLKSTKSSGFILSQESPVFNVDNLDSGLPSGVTLISNYKCGNEHLVLLRKCTEYVEPTTVKISSSDFSWIAPLQQLLKTNEKLVLFAENDPTSGILGFLNSLKLEYGRSDRMKCLFIPENMNNLSVNDLTVREQLKKDLCVNVLKNGVWGSYRQLLLNPNFETSSSRVVLGKDLTWFAAPTSTKQKVLVHYASGRVSNEDSLEMVEFSGVTESGRRIMGLAFDKPICSEVEAQDSLNWEVPANWSLEEAVTVPEAYLHALYTSTFIADWKSTTNIVLHGLSKATESVFISTAKLNNCDVFISDRDGQKSENHLHFGNFNDVRFQKKLGKKGNAHIVVNASDSHDFEFFKGYLAQNGTFFQIAKTESQIPRTVDTCKYVTVDLASAIQQAPIRNKLRSLFQNYLDGDIITPLPVKCINGQELDRNLLMPNDKVFVKVRPNREDRFPCKPRFYCNPNHVYVVIGGFGGFGLEFVEWLIERQAQQVVVCTRNNTLNGYQNFKVNSWKSAGVAVHTSTSDVTTRNGCFQLLKFANGFGSVGGIFNLAVMLKDELFENQTVETFVVPFRTKAFSTMYLDQLSRILCPHLQHFVVFSSYGSVAGNIGQTNYNMANSMVENLCDRRKEVGLPGVAISWGSFADVGLIQKMKNFSTNKVVAGTAQQNVHTCLENLDVLLTQPEAKVSYMALPNTSLVSDDDYQEVIKNIIGITNIKTVSHHVTLPELGMDSLMSVDIQAYLENSYSMTLNMAEIRNLTLARLEELIHPEASS